jgi:hypothetical protein
MVRLKILVLLLLFCLGCATDEAKHDWEEVMKDWRGDNMRMRSDLDPSLRP